MKEADIKMLVARIRQIAYDLHAYLGTGLLEKVYENGLAHRLQKDGFRVETLKPLRVYDNDGFCLGEYFADMLRKSLLREMKKQSCLSLYRTDSRRLKIIAVQVQNRI